MNVCVCACIHMAGADWGSAMHTYYSMHVEVRGQSWVSVLTIYLFEARSLGCLLLSMPGQLAQRPQGILLSLLLAPHRRVIDTGLYHGFQGTEPLKSSLLCDKCFVT